MPSFTFQSRHSPCYHLRPWTPMWFTRHWFSSYHCTRCAASTFGSHSLDLPQTAPGTRLMSISFFPSALLFIDHSFFYIHMLFSLNFLTSFPLFRSTSGKSFFWHFILFCPSCVPCMCIYIYINIYVCVHLWTCTHTHPLHLYLNSLMIYTYLK